jgi:hypothetical protein
MLTVVHIVCCVNMNIFLNLFLLLHVSCIYIVKKNIFFIIEIYGVRMRTMVFNATFNNVSVISWWSVLLVEETGENLRPAANH